MTDSEFEQVKMALRSMREGTEYEDESEQDFALKAAVLRNEWETFGVNAQAAIAQVKEWADVLAADYQPKH